MKRSLDPILVLAALVVLVPPLGGSSVAATPGPGAAPESRTSAPRTAALLPTLPGGAGSVAAVNDHGLMVGSSTTRAGRFVAVTWRRGEIRRLPGLAPRTSSQANAVDERGRVVGMALDGDGRAHAVLWRERRIVDLGIATPYGANATAVSAAGVVATGFAEDAFVGRRAFWVADGSAPEQLELPPGASADAVNDAGTVAGTHSWRNPGDPQFDRYQAFVLADGVRTDLGTLGGPGSTAADLNTEGTVVGTTGTRDDELVAFAWRDGTMTRLPDAGHESPSATAVSDGGVVVGVDGTTSRPLWWADMTSAPETLPLPRRTSGASALDVTDRGTVVGFATAVRRGEFRLLPVRWR